MGSLGLPQAWWLGAKGPRPERELGGSCVLFYDQPQKCPPPTQTQGAGPQSPLVTGKCQLSIVRIARRMGTADPAVCTTCPSVR